MKTSSLAVVIAFCLLLSCGLNASEISPNTGNKSDYALTISGGVSLGVYEAGLNWALVEWTRDRFPDYHFNTSTGASAGAINALISAIHYCSVSQGADPIDNSFYLTWGKLDLTSLLPYDGSGKYDSFPENFKDGLLTRSAFHDMIVSITDAVNGHDFRPGCEINLGFTVTRSIPLDMELTMGTPQRVKAQRFVVPIKLLVDADGFLYFSNHRAYGLQADRFRAYFFLPEQSLKTLQLCHGIDCRQATCNRNNSCTRKIHPVNFQRVLHTVLASSAFPIAFGRVYMDHCVRNAAPEGNPPTLEANESCPGGHSLVNNSFVDGGVFDNIPIGLAVELMEPEARNPRNIDDSLKTGTQKAGHAYVFLDPDKRRGGSTDRSDEEKDDPNKYDVVNQGRFLSGALTVARNDELYESLLSYFHNNKSRQLLLPRRFAPITGAYLMNFATFFSQAFRDYDYAAGLYDGIINIARHGLITEFTLNAGNNTYTADDIKAYIDANIAARVRLVYQELLIEKRAGNPPDNQAEIEAKYEITLAMFHILAKQEFCNGSECDGDWQWVDNKDINAYRFFEGLYIILEQLEIAQRCKVNHINCSDEQNYDKDASPYRRIDSKRVQSVIGKNSRMQLSNLEGGGIYTYYELVISLEKFKIACANRTNELCQNDTSRAAILNMYNDRERYPYLVNIGNKINEIYAIYDRMLSRLSDLEYQAKTGNQKWFDMVGVVLSSRDLKKPYNGHPAWRPTSNDSSWQHLAISADFNGNGYFVTWGRRNLYYFNRTYLQLDGLRLGRNGNDDYNSASLGLNLVWGKDDYLWSTVSLGVRYIVTSEPGAPQAREDIPDSYFAYSVNTGLAADKLRISAEYCDDCAFENGHWKLMLELNDVVSLLKNAF